MAKIKIDAKRYTIPANIVKSILNINIKIIRIIFTNKDGIMDFKFSVPIIISSLIFLLWPDLYEGIILLLSIKIMFSDASI